ncbi:MAG: hypothetical protein O9341_02765 [Paucibacter sp.]|nr:hypothetical protein [Roseateles sp.]
MRLAAFLFLILGFPAMAGEVLIPIQLERLPDPAIERVFQGVKGPTRSLSIPAAWKAELGDSHRIQIRGVISNSELHDLLVKANFQRQRALQLHEKLKWQIEVIVAGEFSKVNYSYVCGALCGVGTDLVFRRSDGLWDFHYKASQWVS